MGSGGRQASAAAAPLAAAAAAAAAAAVRQVVGELGTSRSMLHPSPASPSLLLRLLLGLSLRSLVSDRLAVRLCCKSLPYPRRCRCRRLLLSALHALRPRAGPHGLNLASLPDSAGLSVAVPSRAPAIGVQDWQHPVCAYVREFSLPCINWRCQRHAQHANNNTHILCKQKRGVMRVHAAPAESRARDIVQSRAPGSASMDMYHIS